MPIIGTIITVIIAVAGIALQAQAASDAKGQAKKRQGIEQERLAIQVQERDLRRANELALLRRQARLKRASVLNQAAAQNVRFTTPTSGALNAIRQNLVREQTFSDQTANLARQGDAVTLTQIALETTAAFSRANAQLFSGIVQGIGTAASAVTKPGAFDLGALSSNNITSDVGTS